MAIPDASIGGFTHGFISPLPQHKVQFKAVYRTGTFPAPSVVRIKAVRITIGTGYR